MRKLDREIAKRMVAALGTLPADAQPLWGKMNRDQLYGHLALVMKHMVGDTPPLPFKGNFVSRHIFRRLILLGLVEIPHNVRLPKPKGADKHPEPPTCALADVEQALSEYLDRAEAGTLPQAMHPFFGPLTVNEWRRFHVAHFKHHLKQFGVWNDAILKG